MLSRTSRLSIPSTLASSPSAASSSSAAGPAWFNPQSEVIRAICVEGSPVSRAGQIQPAIRGDFRAIFAEDSPCHHGALLHGLCVTHQRRRRRVLRGSDLPGDLLLERQQVQSLRLQCHHRSHRSHRLVHQTARPLGGSPRRGFHRFRVLFRAPAAHTLQYSTRASRSSSPSVAVTIVSFAVFT